MITCPNCDHSFEPQNVSKPTKTYPKKDFPPIGWQDEMKFGKHKGMTPEQIVASGDPGYIEYLINNTDVKFTEQVMGEIDARR